MTERRPLPLRIPAALLVLLVAVTALSVVCRGALPAQYSGDIFDRKGAFVIYGDSRPVLPLELWRKNADRERNLVVARLAEEAPDFILNTGDLVENGASRSAWERFDREHEPLRRRGIPLFAGLGNHEYWGNESTGMENYFARFPALRNRKWYDLRYRDVLLLVLDSNVKHLAAEERETQLRWLSEQLDRATRDESIRCVLLAAHHPPYTNGVSHGGSEWVRDNIVGAARRCPKVRACFYGHVHSYERFLIDGIHHIVSGGGGAPLVSLLEKADREFADLYDGPRRFHYCRVTVGEEIRVDVIMMDEQEQWSPVDTFRILP